MLSSNQTGYRKPDGLGAHDANVDGDGRVDLPKLQRGGGDAAVLAVFTP